MVGNLYWITLQKLRLYKRAVGMTLLAVLLVCVLLLILENQTGRASHEDQLLQTALEDDSESNFLEPFVTEDFPAGSIDEPLIPHIIHQTYRDEQIPLGLTKYVKSLRQTNPQWTYHLWTDKMARQLVAERHPHLLEMYDGYKSPINRADAIRYIILYEYGGLYADLDVEGIRPLDRLTFKYSCIFPPEPFEQAVFRLNVPYLIGNAIIMCRKNHPFLRYIIDSLHQYSQMNEQLDVAGPTFVTSMFIRYNNISSDQQYQRKLGQDSNSPYFYKGKLPENDKNAVYVPNTMYFINSLSQDWMNEKDYVKICNTKENKRDIERRACNEVNRRFDRPNDRRKFAYTDHHWYKSYDTVKNILRTFKYNWHIYLCLFVILLALIKYCFVIKRRYISFDK